MSDTRKEKSKPKGAKPARGLPRGAEMARLMNAKVAPHSNSSSKSSGKGGK